MKRSQKLSTEQLGELRAFLRDGHRSGREVRRAQTVLLVNQEAEITEIATVTSYSRRQAFDIRRRFLTDGTNALRDARKGKPNALLTKTQREEIIAVVQTKKPSDLDTRFHDDACWITGVLAEYITRTYNVEYKSKTSHYLLFREAKFTYHKPGRVSQRRDEREVQEWRSMAKERIGAAWDDPNTVILAEDEMHLSTQTTVQKIWLPKGEYPKIEIARKRDARSVYGFLNVKTGTEHAFKTKWQNMYITAEILPEVRACYPTQRILLLWDQAGWHKGIEAQNVIQRDGNMETMYFPTAAPDENPQEHVWKRGRAHTTHNRFLEHIDTATDTFVTYLNTTKFSYALVGFGAGL
jgi:transposase